MTQQQYTSPRYISVADTAKLIRVALKENFPGIKFSVRSKSYSGGASIRVEWMDGPTADAVEAITKQYQGASFDGMIDLKSYHDSDLNGEPVHFAADYVFTDRNLSVDFLTKVTAWYCKHYGYDMPTIKESSNGSAYIDSYHWIEQAHADLSTLIYREHRQIDAQYIDQLDAFSELSFWLTEMARHVYYPLWNPKPEQPAQATIQAVVTVLEDNGYTKKVRVLGVNQHTPFRAEVGGELAFTLKRYNAVLVDATTFDKIVNNRVG